MSAALGAAVFTSLILALSWFAQPAEADEIDPDPDYVNEPEPEPEPAPEPDPPPPAAAADELREPDWIPSIDVGMETFDYNVKTAIVNHINGPWLGGNQSEAERQTMFRIGGELMGPMFEDLPGRPRLFAKGGAQFRAFSSDDIFGNGRFTVSVEPERGITRYSLLGDQARDLPREFVGQGSAISARFQDPSWYAGLGFAFSVPIGAEMLLYIKPSVQYSMEEIDFSASLTTVDEPVPRLDPFDCGAGRPPCIREFIPHRSEQYRSITDHSVGAGLEVALALFRSVRPIRVSLYAEARFMWVVSGTTTAFTDPKTIDEPNPVASYTIERDKFDVKGGGGLRFSWVGFD
jgi:hypothetical protein